jgi:transcription initiation factor TFIIF subunit beta
MTDVKPEIKVEGESKLDDLDAFEEDNDLQIPNQLGQAWLIKVSEDMWRAWAKAYKDAPEDARIDVGQLRVFHQKPGDDPNKQKIQIRLDDARPEHKELPKTYNLEMKSNSYNNTVVFSEKDLASLRSTPHARQLGVPRPTAISKQDRFNAQQNRKPGSYRTAIPRQTALAPPVHHEAIANPIEDDTTLNLFAQSYKSALAAGNKTKFIGSQRVRHPGQDNDSFAFGSLTSKPGKGKKKAPKEKAVRMDKDKLLDAIRNCFTEYQYWSLRALRMRLNQPEAYIKEMLDDVATLVKSGDFVQNYKLKAEYQRLNEMDEAGVKPEVAPEKMEEESDEGTGDEMDDAEEEGDFEDVKME